MKFQKGQSGNPSGRPRGAKNKATTQLLELVTHIVINNAKRLQQDIELLEPKDRVRILASLLNYVLPKQQSITPPSEQHREGINFIGFTQDDINNLKKLKEKI